MTQDQRLEHYLTSLENVLKPFPVSDRAEIVTEIKSHVLSALERDPQTRMDTVLAALGEPETVANRYLMERGLKPTKPPVSPIVKWIVIGFLGTFAMVLIFGALVVTRFSPLLQVDDRTDSVSILGGLIQVDGENGKVLINGVLKINGDSGKLSTLEGSVPLTTEQAIVFKFGNGKVAIGNAENARFAWDCKHGGSPVTAPAPITDKMRVSLDLTSLSSVKCDLKIPQGARLSLEGANGKLDFEKPKFNLSVKLSNGKVNFDPNTDVDYRYNLAVNSGKMDTFSSSDKAGAYSVVVHLTNGKISRGN